jgi:hypothetical protein
MNRHIIPLVAIAGCSDVEKEDHHHDHNHGLPTTAILTFVSDDGTEELTFRWSQPDSHDDPMVETVELREADGGYTMHVQILNEAEDPAIDITPEIAQFAAEHQLFFTGDAVSGPATGENEGAVIEHAYADEDEDGLPIGLENSIAVIASGTGTLDVMLRHMPSENGRPVKVEGVAELVAEEGFSAVGGDIDLSVSFPVVVE